MLRKRLKRWDGETYTIEKRKRAFCKSCLNIWTVRRQQQHPLWIYISWLCVLNRFAHTISIFKKFQIHLQRLGWLFGVFVLLTQIFLEQLFFFLLKLLSFVGFFWFTFLTRSTGREERREKSNMIAQKKVNNKQASSSSSRNWTYNIPEQEPINSWMTFWI